MVGAVTRRRPVSFLGTALPLIVYVLATIALYIAHPARVWESPMLLDAANAAALVVALVGVAAGAFGFLHDGSSSLLTLCIGIFAFGLALLVGSVLLDSVSLDAGIAVHNILSLVSGVLLLYSAGSSGGFIAYARRRLVLIRSFAIASAGIALITFLAARGLLPAFVHADGSSSAVRTIVLGAAALSFVIAATAASQIARVTGERFMRLYALGLAFIALGLMAVALGSPGSATSWAGRLSQITGQLYIVYGLFSTIRGQRSIDVPVGAAIAESFHRVQAALGRSRAQLEAAVESMNDAVFISDLEGNFTTVNTAFARFYRFASKADAWRLFSDYPDRFDVFFADGTPAPPEEWAMPRALRGETASDQEYIIRVKETGETWIGSYSLAPIRDESGQTLGAVVVSRDITESKRAAEHERAEARLHAALLKIDALIHSSFNRDQVFDGVLPESVQALDADTAVVLLRHEGDWRLKHTYGLPDQPVDVVVAPEELPFVQQVAARRETAFVEDMQVEPRAGQSRLRAIASARAMMYTPVIVRGETWAVIAIGYSAAHEFTEPERWFAERLTASLGLALANIELYESEHAIAETLQETLVVVRSHVPGIDFSRSYRSASYEAGTVGGDFIDVFEVSRNLVGLSLGDVSGKGIDAAVTTSLIRNTLRVHALDGLAPAAVAEKANMVMGRFVEQDSFVTLWFGLLDTSSGALTYVCAGHPPPLVLTAEGEVLPLECCDPFLGVFADMHFTERRATMERRQRLVVYSDGVIEARSPDGSLLGEEALREMLVRERTRTTAEMSGVLMGEVIAYSAGVLRDDVAILVVEPLEVRERA